MERPTQAAWLVAIALAGQACAYVLSVVLARRLGVAGFEAYVVASAVFIVLAAFAPRGSEKHLLRQLPALLRRQDWPGANGLLRFGARRTLVTAVGLGLLVAAWAWQAADRTDQVRLAILVTCLSLPAGALAHCAVEALTAAGRPLRALAAFKLLTPALVLCMTVVLLALSAPLTGPIAVGAWGLAWIVVLAAMAFAFRRAAPPEIFTARPAGEATTWRSESRPFFVYRVSLVLLAQAGVIALELLQPSAVAVGAYAAAAASAGMAAVLATSTNRAYGRELSLLLEQGDFHALLAVRRARLTWLVPALALFLALALAFPAQVLRLFRPEFAAEGATALRILALSTAFTVFFSLAPTYLKFQQRNGVIYGAMAAAAAGQLLLLWLLIPPFGAAGAAAAHALSMCGMYGAFALLGHREVRALRRSA